MKAGMIKSVSFGEKLGIESKEVYRKSLVNERNISRSEMLDDVFEYCRKQKEESQKNTPLYFDMKEKLTIMNSDNPMATLLDLINKKADM